jgi:hypothetical protein
VAAVVQRRSVCGRLAHSGSDISPKRRAGLVTSVNGMVRPCSCPASKRSWQGAPTTRSTPCLRHSIA